MIHTKVDIRNSIQRVIAELQQHIEPGLTISRMPDGSLNVSADHRSTLKSIRRQGDLDSVIRSLIIDGCEKSESIGMGSTKYLIKILGNINSLYDQGFNPERIKNTVKDVIDLLPSISTPVSKKAIDSCLFDAIPDSAALVSHAIDVAGSECKIFVEPSTTGFTSIERIDGNTFTCIPDPSFFKSGKWVGSDVKCLVVDGLIEKVSEIDSLLQRCNESKRTMAIFARGYSEEVASTLRVNFLRKTLNVMPISIEFDLETANVLLDIAAVLRCDVTSSLKGELISTIKFDDIAIAKELSCVGSSVTIKTANHSQLQIHLKNLIKRRNEEVIPTLKRILDKRIRSLSSSTVTIRVDDSGARGSKVLHDIDTGLKIVRNILQYGSITEQSIKNCKMDLPVLTDVVVGNCPTLVLGSALNYSLSVFETLNSAVVAVN